MYGNGAGTGIMASSIPILGLLVRRRAITVSGVAPLGLTPPTCARLLTATATTRVNATMTLASALFAPRSSTLVVAVESRAYERQAR